MAFLAGAIGLVAAAVIYLPLFPSMKTPELAGLLDSLPPELVRTLGYENISTGAGYAQATFFGLIGFVLITIAGVGWGAAFIGGAEESGRLELTFAHGVGRVHYALESAAALVVKLLVLGMVAYAVVWVVNGPAELELDVGNLLSVTVAWVGVGLLSATAALAGGALTGRRVWGVGVGSGVAVVGYVMQAVANNSEDLDGCGAFSPFDWAFGEAPLTNGADWAGSGPALGRIGGPGRGGDRWACPEGRARLTLNKREEHLTGALGGQTEAMAVQHIVATSAGPVEVLRVPRNEFTAVRRVRRTEVEGRRSTASSSGPPTGTRDLRTYGGRRSHGRCQAARGPDFRVNPRRSITQEARRDRSNRAGCEQNVNRFVHVSFPKRRSAPFEYGADLGFVAGGDGGI